MRAFRTGAVAFAGRRCVSWLPAGATFEAPGHKKVGLPVPPQSDDPRLQVLAMGNNKEDRWLPSIEELDKSLPSVAEIECKLRSGELDVTVPNGEDDGDD